MITCGHVENDLASSELVGNSLEDDSMPSIEMKTSTRTSTLDIEKQSLIIFDEDLIANFLELLNRKLHPEAYRETKNFKHFLSISSKALLYLIACNAGVPFMKPASEFTNDTTLGYFYAGSIYFALGGVSTWAIRDYFEYVSLIKHNAKENKLTEITLVVSSFLIALASSLPSGIIAYRYNSNYWLLALSLFLDISSNTCSLNNIFRKLNNDRRFRRLPALKKLRDLILERLQYGFYYANSIISNFLTEDSELSESSLINLIKATSLSSLPMIKIRQQHPRIFNTGHNYATNFFGYLLPLSWEVTIFYLVYKDTHKEFNFNPFLAAITASLTTIPSYLLEIRFAKLLTSRIYNAISESRYGIYEKIPALLAYPSITKLTTFLLTSTVIFCYSTRGKVIHDEFENGIIKDILLFSAIIGTLLFKMSAMLSNAIKLINQVAITKHKNLDFIYEKFIEEITIVIKNSKPETTHRLLEKIDIQESIDEKDMDNELATAIKEWKDEKLSLSSKTQHNCWARIFCCKRNKNLSGENIEDNLPKLSKTSRCVIL